MLTGFAIQSPQGAKQTNAFTQSFGRPAAAPASAEQPAQFSPTPAAFNSGTPVRFAQPTIPVGQVGNSTDSGHFRATFWTAFCPVELGTELQCVVKISQKSGQKCLKLKVYACLLFFGFRQILGLFFGPKL